MGLIHPAKKSVQALLDVKGLKEGKWKKASSAKALCVSRSLVPGRSPPVMLRPSRVVGMRHRAHLT